MSAISGEGDILSHISAIISSPYQVIWFICFWAPQAAGWGICGKHLANNVFLCFEGFWESNTILFAFNLLTTGPD